MRNRAIVVVLLVAIALCILASVASAGGVRATNPLGQRVQNTGLIWGGNGNAPVATPSTMSLDRRFAFFADLIDQISRPSWRRFPGQGWWGDFLQFD